MNELKDIEQQIQEPQAQELSPVNEGSSFEADERDATTIPSPGTIDEPGQPSGEDSAKRQPENEPSDNLVFFDRGFPAREGAGQSTGESATLAKLRKERPPC